MVSQGNETDARLGLEVMLSCVVMGHLSQSTVCSDVLYTLTTLRGPRPKLQFSSAGRFSSSNVLSVFNAEKFRAARLGNPSSLMLSIDWRDDDEMERSDFPELIWREANDLGPLSWISDGAEAEKMMRPEMAVHLFSDATSSGEEIVKSLR